MAEELQPTKSTMKKGNEKTVEYWIQQTRNFFTKNPLGTLPKNFINLMNDYEQIETAKQIINYFFPEKKSGVANTLKSIVTSEGTVEAMEQLIKLTMQHNSSKICSHLLAKVWEKKEFWEKLMRGSYHAAIAVWHTSPTAQTLVEYAISQGNAIFAIQFLNSYKTGSDESRYDSLLLNEKPSIFQLALNHHFSEVDLANLIAALQQQNVVQKFIVNVLDKGEINVIQWLIDHNQNYPTIIPSPQQMLYWLLDSHKNQRANYFDPPINIDSLRFLLSLENIDPRIRLANQNYSAKELWETRKPGLSSYYSGVKAEHYKYVLGLLDEKIQSFQQQPATQDDIRRLEAAVKEQTAEMQKQTVLFEKMLQQLTNLATRVNIVEQRVDSLQQNTSGNLNSSGMAALTRETDKFMTDSSSSASTPDFLIDFTGSN